MTLLHVICLGQQTNITNGFNAEKKKSLMIFLTRYFSYEIGTCAPTIVANYSVMSMDALGISHIHSICYSLISISTEENARQNYTERLSF